MLTIENIHKVNTGTFRVGKDVWEITNIKTASDRYQFALKCIEAHPAVGVNREVILNLHRQSVAGYLGRNGELIYRLENHINNKSMMVDWSELRAPGLFCGPILKMLEGC